MLGNDILTEVQDSTIQIIPDSQEILPQLNQTLKNARTAILNLVLDRLGRYRYDLGTSIGVIWTKFNTRSRKAAVM